MRFNILIFLLFSVFLHAQKECVKDKKEAMELIKQLNNAYEKKENLENFFTYYVQCLVCDIDDGYENEYIIENKKFIQNNLKESIGLLNDKVIEKSKTHFSKQENSLVLSYETLKPNKKTGFEGASALIIFKREDGKLKIHGIQTIP